MNVLPLELQLRMLQYLDPSSLLNCTTVCRTWRSLILDNANKFTNKFELLVRLVADQELPEGQVVFPSYYDSYPGCVMGTSHVPASLALAKISRVVVDASVSMPTVLDLPDFFFKCVEKLWFFDITTRELCSQAQAIIAKCRPTLHSLDFDLVNNNENFNVILDLMDRVRNVKVCAWFTNGFAIDNSTLEHIARKSDELECICFINGPVYVTAEGMGRFLETARFTRKDRPLICLSSIKCTHQALCEILSRRYRIQIYIGIQYQLFGDDIEIMMNIPVDGHLR